MLIAVARGLIARLPLTGAMVYPFAGFALGRAGVGMLNPEIEGNLRLLRILTERDARSYRCRAISAERFECAGGPCEGPADKRLDVHDCLR